MSFGSALKFSVESQNGKPSIQWQQENKQKKSRKYGYKSKDLRHPVRKIGEENNENEVEQKDEKKEEKKYKQPDFVKKNRGKFHKTKESKSDQNIADKGTVTLTQEQLNAILESVGKLATGTDKSLRINIDKELHEVKIEKPVGCPENVENVDPNKPESEKSTDAKHEDGKRKEENKKPEESRKTKDSKKTKDNKKMEMSSDKKESTNRITEDQADSEKSKQDAGQHTGSQSEMPLPPPIPWAHLTVAEKKRIQWARERDQMSQQEYDPWGRPGAGAPLRNDSGQVIADLSKHKDELKDISLGNVSRQFDGKHQPASSTKQNDARGNISHQSDGVKTAATEYIPPPAMRSSLVIGHVAPDEDRYSSSKDQEKKRWLEELEKQREEQRLRKLMSREKLRNSSENDWDDYFTHKSEAPSHETKKERLHVDNITGVSHHQAIDHGLPTVVESVFPFDMGMPDNNCKNSGKKEEEKRKYLKELERQIEEKNRQKLKELEQERQADLWADRSMNGPPVVDDYGPDEVTGRTSSAPHPATSLESDHSKHLRGQHIVLDPVTHRELEEKKRKHMEYQQAVRQQIEEKQRLKQMERQHKLQEEMEEELRLQKQRDTLQKQYEEEQNKLKNKEEARQHQIAQLKSAMDEARERAQQEKTLRRLHQLERGGHDVSYLKAQLQGSSPRQANSDIAFVPHLDLSGRSGYTQFTPHLPQISAGNPSNTTKNGRAADNPRHAETMETEQFHHDAYVMDRVLTPCRYRHPSRPHCESGSPRRDFGTQTLDGLVLSQINLAREPSDVQIVYKKDKKEIVYKEKTDSPAKTVRIKSAAKEDRKEVKRLKSKEKLKPGDMKWNYQNRKNKKALKQSERDPFYEVKQSESEERRAKRKQRLLALVEANRDVIPTEKSRDSSPERSSEHLAGPARTDQSRSPGRSGNRATRRGDPAGHAPAGQNSVESATFGADESSSRERQDSRPKKTRKSRSTERRALPVHHSQESQQQQQQQVPESHSPPVPALKHKMNIDTVAQPEILKIGHTDSYENDYNVESFNYSNYYPPPPGDRDLEPDDNYRDLSPDLPIYRGDFIPFTRTADILDPSRAAEPIPLSRENTRVVQARQAYAKNQAPGSLGSRLDYMQGDTRKGPDTNTNNPLINPSLLKDHPTARQDLILQQLSTLKQSLRQRQRELETCMSPSDFDQ